jgi:seryl-tRNA synthetase
MTAEEVVQQKLAKEQEIKQKEEKERLRQWDERLLLRYSQTSEIVKAKFRALSIIDVAIALNENNLARLKTDIETQQKEAAEIERKGEQISETRKATLIAFKNELQLVIDSIDQREKEKVVVAKDYDADIERFKMLRESLDTYNNRQQGL